MNEHNGGSRAAVRQAVRGAEPGLRARVAVFPVAGLGTRVLPATKAIPKELLPVVDRPVLQYAVEEARSAGIERFVFVTAQGKSALEDHFSRAPFLETLLEVKGKTELLEAVKDAALPEGALAAVRQPEALGLGHAVWCARAHIGDEPFAVLLPDELLLSDPPCLADMVAAQSELGGAVIATMEVPRADTKRYGVLDPAGPEGPGRLTPAQGFVEKPDPDEAPSTMSLIGRYVLPGGIMDVLDGAGPGAGGEIQITDAIDALVGQCPVHGFRFAGARHDCGSIDGYALATLAVALERPGFRAAAEALLAAAKRAATD